MEAKEEFLANYDLAVKNWVDRHPGWERLIAGSAVGVDQVRGRLGFGWQFYKVVPPENAMAAGNLEAEVGGLGHALFGEIARDALGAWAKVYAGKTEVSHKALSPLKAMRQKLMNLSFVEPLATPIVNLMDEALSCVPKRGLIRGRSLLVLQGLVSVLRDPVAMRGHGQKILGGQTPSDMLPTIGGTSFGPADAPGDDVPNGPYGLDDLDNLDVRDPLGPDKPMGQPVPDDLDDPDDSGCPSVLSADIGEDGQTDNISISQPQKSPNLDSLGLW
jgi:hypothetical protein